MSTSTMDVMSTGSKFILAYTLLSSLWTLFNAMTAARLLLLYEDATKKAAKYTSIAATQLSRTRKTQTAGTIASLSSSASAVMAIYWSFDAESSGDPTVQRNLFITGAANAGICLWVRRYMGKFWAGSARSPLPGTTEYNDAVRSTEQVLKWLRIVAMAWASVMAVNYQW